MRQNLPVTRQARESTDGAEAGSGPRSRARSFPPLADAAQAGDGHHRTEVLELVEGLAFRAHLVALDAAVEAALAGEHGRRFGAVAAEMLQLARHTADAAEHIRGRLDGVRGPA